MKPTGLHSKLLRTELWRFRSQCLYSHRTSPVQAKRSSPGEALGLEGLTVPTAHQPPVHHDNYHSVPTSHASQPSGGPRIKVPYSKNPVYVAEGYSPPVVAGRNFEYETTPKTRPTGRRLLLLIDSI